VEYNCFYFIRLLLDWGQLLHFDGSIISSTHINKTAITIHRDGGFYTIVHGLRMVEKNVFAFGERARVAIYQARTI
jgi:hypothetical protein